MQKQRKNLHPNYWFDVAKVIAYTYYIDVPSKVDGVKFKTFGFCTVIVLAKPFVQKYCLNLLKIQQYYVPIIYLFRSQRCPLLFNISYFKSMLLYKVEGTRILHNNIYV